MPGRRPHALPSASCEPCHRVPLRSLAALLPPCPSCGPSPPPPRWHTRALQADPRYARGGMGSAVRQLMKSEGAVGLYRGIVPIVASTGIQKSALFSANAGARRACEQSGIPALTEPIPFTSLSPSLLVGGVAAGTARTVVETPFELAKVRYQTGGGVTASTGLLSLGQVAVRVRLRVMVRVRVIGL